jgi:hypothetical protein
MRAMGEREPSALARGQLVHHLRRYDAKGRPGSRGGANVGLGRMINALRPVILTDPSFHHAEQFAITITSEAFSKVAPRGTPAAASKSVTPCSRWTGI